MHIGVLLCDDIDESAQSEFGNYFDMFARQIGARDPELTFTPVRSYQGEQPESVHDYDGYLVSGSRYSAYEDLPWVAELMEFLRQCRAARRKLVGICFGHQVIAHALGGETVRAEAGWGFGIHTAEVTASRPWMNGSNLLRDGHYNLVVIHQDQVVRLPDDFEVIARSDFCPVSMYTDDDTVLGIQGHPEFDKRFCEFRTHARRDRLPDETFHRSLESLEELDLDADEVLGWIARFFRHSPATTRP